MYTQNVKYWLSAINKVKKIENIKKSIPKKTMKSYQYGDYVGKANYQLQKQYLSPYQQRLIETKSMERPFTGMLWAEKSVGFYHCVVCETRLFSYDNKYDSRTGFATFWRAIPGRVRVVEGQVNFDNVNFVRFNPMLKPESYKRCQCQICSSNLGAVFFDGPFPTFLRYSINSSLLKFKVMEDFPDPNILKKKKKIERQKLKPIYIQ